MTLDELIQHGPVADASPAGMAAIYYRIGNQPPVQVLTQFSQNTAEPKSLVLWFYDPSIEPVRFLMYVAIQNIYIGPGEYKGNVNDIQVGLGVASNENTSLTWTANQTTATDLTTYFISGGSLLGTFSVDGLVPGPILGAPDDPAPPNQPSLDVLFCYFSNQGTA